MPRLLSVIHGPIYGGSASQLLRLREPLSRRGWDTVAVMPEEPGNAVPRLRDAGVEVITLPLHRLRATIDPATQVRFLSGLRREVRRLRRIIERQRADLVQVHGDTNPQAGIAGHLEDVAVVWQMLDTRTPLALRRATMPLVTRLADVITTWGWELGRQYPGVLSLGDRHVTVFPPVAAHEFGADPARRARARAELGASEGTCLIGTVGNRNPQKGHEWLLRAAHVVRGSRAHVRVVILGAPSPAHSAYEHQLGEEAIRAARGELEAVRLVDPGLRVPELLSALDVFVLSSVPRSEGMPTAIVEAMACAIPVVATDVGAVRELIDDGEDGLVVPAEDSAALASAIGRLVDDRDLRANLGAAGRRRMLESFDLERCADLHSRAYERALEHRRGRRGRDPGTIR